MPPWVAFAVRVRPGVWEYIRVNLNALVVEELSVPQYLQFKEELVDGPYVSILSKCCIICLSPCRVTNVGCADDAGKMATSFSSWILNPSPHLSRAQPFPSQLGMELSSSTGTSLLKCSMTRKACSHSLIFSKSTTTRER